MKIPRISVVLNWRDSDNKSGLYSIHLRISIGSVSKYFKIEVPQKVRLEEWSGKEDEWVKQIHPFAFDINNVKTG